MNFNWKNIIKQAQKIGVMTLAFAMAIQPAHARILFESEYLLENNGNAWVIDSQDDVSGNLTLQFGNTLGETLTWNSGTTEFDLSDDLNVTGGVTASGTITANGTLDANGTVTLGDGGDSITIDSSNWDISSTGVASGFTGITSTGTINFSGASRLALHQGVLNPLTCTEGDIFYNSLLNTTYVCTATNTWTALGGGGSSDFEAVYGADAGNNLDTSNGNFTITTGTADFVVDSNDWNVDNAGNLDAQNITANATLDVNGAATIGDGGDTVVIDSSDWDISATGDISGAGTITADGLITGTAGATISGATTSINSSSNFVTNINTGTSTGQVNIGGNANCVTVDSNTWDISCSGLATGFTGITSSGNINFTTANSFRVPQAASDPGTCSIGQEYYNTTSNTLRVCTSTNTWSSVGASSTQYVFAYDTNTQTVATAGTFQNVTFSNNGQIQGWTHTPTSADFIAAVDGLYLVTISARVAKAGGANTSLSLRGTLNNVEIAGSQTAGSASSSTGDSITGNFIMPVTAGNTFRVQMTGGTSNAQILPEGTGTTRPSIAISIVRIN